MNKAVEKKVIDKEALKQKYMEERNKRLRPDGNAQYIRIENQLSHYLDDPYVPFKERAPKTDHVTVAFIGGGYAGLVTWPLAWLALVCGPRAPRNTSPSARCKPPSSRWIWRFRGVAFSRLRCLMAAWHTRVQARSHRMRTVMWLH